MTIVVTGGSGFLGRFVVEQLRSKYDNVISLNSKDYNLIDNSQVIKMYENCRPNIIIHLAAEVGGIGANMNNPGRFFYSNMSMGLNLVENARIFGLKKFVFVSTVCAYPKFATAPFTEDDMWNGYPEETNAPYGIAKKAIMVMLQGYKTQYGLKSCVLVPTNLYGPYDNFNPNSSHVIPALIRKCTEAKQNHSPYIECWGDGSATREFLYVEDAARGIVAGTGKVDDPQPINLGSGNEVSIKNLVEKIAEMVGYGGKILWDTSKPNGQPRRFLDVTKAKQYLEWQAQECFDTGLKKTIQYYVNLK
jgi:GDP-L-fucose synthase